MEERDEKILRHLGLYHISLRAVLEQVFFEGNKRACDNVLTRLRKNKLIAVRQRAFPGGLSYYQLTPNAARDLGVPAYRAKVPEGQSLSEKIAVLWFCCFDGRRRHKLEKNKLEEVFGQVFPGPHCFEQDPDVGGYRIYRIFTPAANDEDQLRQVREHLDTVTDRGCYEWVQTGVYGVAILTETETRREKLLQEIESKKLINKAFFVVQGAPTPNTLKEAISALPDEGSPRPTTAGADPV